MSPRSVTVRTTSLLWALVFASAAAVAPAAAQEGPFPTRLTLVPTEDTASAGTCNEFTARVTGGEIEGPVQGVTVDVRQVLADPGTEPDETRELSFCDPVGGSGANPTGQGGTAFGNVSGNNPGSTAGGTGRNTTVHGEVGPTNANGEVTFGISITSGPGTVTVSAWVDSSEADDFWSEGEPGDTSTKTWTIAEVVAVTAVDAAPEAVTNPNGSTHQVSVTMTSNAGPVQGVVPNSVIVANGGGRPAGDVANELAGPSPNQGPGPNVYACTASDAAGVSTCTFSDPPGTPPGTDTVVFYVNQAGGGTADPDAGEPQDAVQVTWQNPPPGPNPTPPPGGPPEPRNIQLCHGADTGAACVTATQQLAIGDDHTLSARVTGAQGNPMQGVPVEFRETGPATFPGGGSLLVVSTDSAGVARASMSTDVAGTSVVVAEISPPALPGSVRGPGASDDECEQPAGPGGTPGAGNCTASVSTVWTTAPHPEPECDDDLDNDNDGLIDDADPGCIDGTEAPFGPEPRFHDRRINMRFRDWVGPGDEGLAIFGRLRLSDENDNFRACTAGRPVEIQRRLDGEWVTKKFTTTNQKGRYAGVLFDVTGEHRAVAPRVQVIDGDGVAHVCRRAQRVKTHHHRR
ncbi:MAG TPA: Ig-like domain-containing protein [Actinomycetota bacterium]|nr:Ig-like domain-containing protein [Actinomycetota bacterium]